MFVLQSADITSDCWGILLPENDPQAVPSGSIAHCLALLQNGSGTAARQGKGASKYNIQLRLEFLNPPSPLYLQNLGYFLSNTPHLRHIWIFSPHPSKDKDIFPPFLTIANDSFVIAQTRKRMSPKEHPNNWKHVEKREWGTQPRFCLLSNGCSYSPIRSMYHRTMV